jgi:hypothetical protein
VRWLGPAWATLAGIATTAGCASSSGGPAWYDMSSLEIPDPGAYDEGYDAEYLVKQKRIELVLTPNDSYTDLDRHRVIAILSEDGQDQYSDVKIVYPKKAEIRAFQARVIPPAGEPYVAEPDRVLDVESEDDEGLRVRTLFMPKVSVGSVLEWRATTRYPWIFGTYEDYMNDDEVPVRRSRVTITGSKGVGYYAQTYNLPGGKSFELEKRGRTWRMSLELEDLMPRPDEDYRPPRDLEDPWFAYVTRYIKRGGDVYGWSSTWDEALDLRGAELYWNSDEWYNGFDVEVDVTDCGLDVLCKLEKNLAWLRAELPSTGWGSYPGRKAKTVLGVGSATGVEKNRILHRLLAEQGVTSHFAFARRFYEAPFDEARPTWQGMNRLVLLLPEQAGLRKPRWVDGGCEYCAVGEVPRVWLGTRAAVLVPSTSALSASQGELKVRFEPIKGDPPRRGWTFLKSDIRIRADGALEITDEIVKTFEDAQFARESRRTLTDEEREQRAKRHVSRRDETGQLLSFEKERYAEDMRQSNWEVRYEIPNFAIPSDDEIVVPLSLLSSGWDDEFAEKDRSSDINFWYSYRNRQRYTFTPPPGWEVVQHPESAKVGASPMVVDLEWEPKGRGARFTRTYRMRRGRYDKEMIGRLRETLVMARDVRNGSLILRRASGG